MKITLESFGTHLKKRIEREGHTIGSFAVETGISRIHLSRIINGHVVPTDGVLDKLGLQYELAIVPKPPTRKKGK